jgi:hypothetical protein
MIPAHIYVGLYRNRFHHNLTKPVSKLKNLRSDYYATLREKWALEKNPEAKRTLEDQIYLKSLSIRAKAIDKIITALKTNYVQTQKHG